MTGNCRHVSLAVSMCWMMLAAFSQPAFSEELVDAKAAYDSNNVFARILRGELPADVVYENDHALAFHDIWPQARVHVLVIPKGPYANINSFNSEASSQEILGLLDAISQATRIMGVDASGFRILSNTGWNGGQTVAHLHFHLLGGEPMGDVGRAQPLAKSTDPSPTAKHDSQVIEALYSAYCAAWLRNDETSEKAVLSLFRQDAVIFPSGGKMMFKGHEEMKGFWFHPDAAPSTIDQFEQETIRVTVGTHEGTLLSLFRLQFSSGGKKYVTEGYNTLSAILVQGDWKISSMMWSHPPWEQLD